MDLQALGFTKEELQQRVVDQICSQLLTSLVYDYESDNDYAAPTPLKRELEKRIAAQIDASISALAEKHVLPNVAQYIENLTLQQTNQWGEKRGEPVSFTEYLVGRAEAYMQEKVNYEGKSQAENGGYSWTGTQTRITHLVHRHLHHSIETAMKNALQIATSSIATGLEATVKQKLAEVSDKLKVSVSTK